MIKKPKGDQKFSQRWHELRFFKHYYGVSENPETLDNKYDYNGYSKYEYLGRNGDHRQYGYRKNHCFSEK